MRRDRTDQIVLCSTDSTPDQDLTLKDLDRRDRRRGYLRCVYHFVIRRSGEIEHGPRHHTVHAMHLGRHHNASSVAVCLVGGQGEPPFTSEQRTSLRALITELKDEYPDVILKHLSTPVVGFDTTPLYPPKDNA